MGRGTTSTQFDTVSVACDFCTLLDVGIVRMSLHLTFNSIASVYGDIYIEDQS